MCVINFSHRVPLCSSSTAVSIQFTELDYSGGEQEGQAVVKVERIGTIATPVTVRVVPLTYTEYLSLGYVPITGVQERATGMKNLTLTLTL